MGHLLQTVNPEAAAAIQPVAERRRLPEVGETVRYHMRQGFGRQGRTVFSALVQGHGERDTLMLTVVVDAGDLFDESLVTEIGPGNEFHCWERVSGAGVRPLAERLEEPAGLRGLVASLDEQVGEVREIILGDFSAPKVSIIAIMQDFENRLRAVKAENVELRQLVLDMSSGQAFTVSEPPLAKRGPKPGKRPAKKAAKRGRKSSK